MRKILTPLLVIPFGMLIYMSLRADWQTDNSGLEYLFLIIGIPILAFNFFAWFQPEILTAHFPVRKEWFQKTNDRSVLPVVVGTFIVIVLVGIGTASNGDAYRSVEPSPVRVAANTVFPTFAPLPSRTATPGRSVVSRDVQSPTVGNVQNAQIPLSGEVIGVTATPTADPTTIALLAERCLNASPEILDAVTQGVKAASSNNKLGMAWTVESRALEGLWFVGAKIQMPAGATPPAVWALLFYSEGYFDVYAVNDTAMQYSETAWGEGNDPPITMEIDGAQDAYDCAIDGE